jgi:hypothetical protein
LLEAGPRLIFKFLPPDWDQELDASIAACAVFSTDLPINWRYQGLVINPRLSYRDERFHEGRLRLGASTGPLFGFGGLNRYFYEVQPRFARPDRPSTMRMAATSAPSSRSASPGCRSAGSDSLAECNSATSIGALTRTVRCTGTNWSGPHLERTVGIA